MKPQEESKQEAFEYKEHKTLSSLKVMALSDKGPQIYTFNCSNQVELETLTKDEGYPEFYAVEIAKFSPLNGGTIAVVDPFGMYLVDVNSKQLRLKIDRPGIVDMQWTPRENYIVTCDKYKAGTNEKNLVIWSAKTGE